MDCDNPSAEAEGRRDREVGSCVMQVRDLVPDEAAGAATYSSAEALFVGRLWTDRSVLLAGVEPALGELDEDEVCDHHGHEG